MADSVKCWTQRWFLFNAPDSTTCPSNWASLLRRPFAHSVTPPCSSEDMQVPVTTVTNDGTQRGRYLSPLSYRIVRVSRLCGSAAASLSHLALETPPSPRAPPSRTPLRLFRSDHHYEPSFAPPTSEAAAAAGLDRRRHLTSVLPSGGGATVASSSWHLSFQQTVNIIAGRGGGVCSGTRAYVVIDHAMWQCWGL